MLLTDEERGRFAEYLIQDSKGNRLIAAQLESIPTLMRMKLKLADAEELVARELLNVESFTIG